MPRTVKRKKSPRPLVGLIMGSKSDWETMNHAIEILEEFKVPYEANVISAHRTPKRLFAYATAAAMRGIKVLIAGAGGAAHLPGVTAALTHLPVLGIPVQSKALDGLDSLLSIVQMPAGVPVGTLAIGRAGSVNAGLMAVSILALEDKDLSARLRLWRAAQMAALTPTPSKGARKAKTRKGKR